MDIDVNVNGANQLKALDKGLQKTENTSKALNNSLRTVGVTMSAYFGVQTLRALGSYADAWTSINSKLKLVTVSTNQLASVQLSLFDVANKSRQGIEETVTLYSRLARATKSAGTSQKDLITVTSTINKALTISGATAQESASAITQLSQAIASGVLRGEEYNSISENGSRINEIFAKSLGVTSGELRKLAADGKITTEVMLKALLEETKNVNAEFEKMNTTIAQSMTILNNSFGAFISRLDEATGISDIVSDNITRMADALNLANFSFTLNEEAMRENYKEQEKRDAADKVLIENEKEKAQVLKESTADLYLNAEAIAAINKWDQEQADLLAASIQLEHEQTQAIVSNTQAKQDNANATIKQLQAETQYYTQPSWRNADGTIKDVHGSTQGGSFKDEGFEYTIATPINNFVTSIDNSTNALNNYNTTINTIDSSMRDLKRSLQNISDSLGTDYSSGAREALFGGSTNSLSYKEAKANAQAAWDLFQTDTSSEDFLSTYNDRMDDLIGTLDDFADSSRYDSKAQQDFEKHKALRDIKNFEKGQLDTKTDIDKQLLVLESIDEKTKKDATTARTNYVQTGVDQIKENRQTAVIGTPDSYTSFSEWQTVGLKPKFGYKTTSGNDQGYKSGGYTGDASTNTIAGQVHGQEYVVNASTTKDLGINNGGGGVFKDMLANLYEINKTTKRSLSTSKQILSRTEAVSW